MFVIVIADLPLLFDIIVRTAFLGRPVLLVASLGQMIHIVHNHVNHINVQINMEDNRSL